jgi:hypothetical protein
MTSSNGPLIVLSTGRTGTNYLSQRLQAQGIYDLSHQGKYSRLINILGNVGLCVKSDLLQQRILPKLIESTGRSLNTADPLLSVSLTLILSNQISMHKLKVLHIVRDPRDFVTSFMNWRRQKTRRMFLHHCVPFWQPNPWCAGQTGMTSYIKMSKFEHFCWIWAYKNSFFERKWKKRGVDYLRIRLEDMSNQTNMGEKLSSFLGLQEISFPSGLKQNQLINKSDSTHFPKWKHWSKHQADILYKHCAQLMDQYGYGLEPEWKELIKKQ